MAARRIRHDFGGSSSMLAAALGYSTPRETDRATVTSTLLTQIDDALTAAAISPARTTPRTPARGPSPGGPVRPLVEPDRLVGVPAQCQPPGLHPIQNFAESLSRPLRPRAASATPPPRAAAAAAP